MGRGPPRGLARLGPAYAASSPAMSSFTIFKIAWATRRAFAGSASSIISPSRAGTIRHERPYFSLSQPHCSALPPARSAFQ
jgi:hypothetical protein